MTKPTHPGPHGPCFCKHHDNGMLTVCIPCTLNIPFKRADTSPLIDLLTPPCTCCGNRHAYPQHRASVSSRCTCCGSVHHATTPKDNA